jgi:HEAT repeat protein
MAAMICTSLCALLALGLPRGRPPAQGEPPPAPRSEQEVREQLEVYLGSIDTPISLERWRALGAQAAPILEEIATSTSYLPTRRARALEGLSAVGGPEVATRMLQIAQSDEQPAVVRMSAMRGVGRLMTPRKLVPALRPVLEKSPDVQIRAAAAEVLARHAPQKACGLVRAQLGREPESQHNAYRRAIASCSEP